MMYFISSDCATDFSLCGWLSFFKKRLDSVRICDLKKYVDNPANTIFYYATSFEHSKHFSAAITGAKAKVFAIIVAANLEESFSIRNIASIFDNITSGLLIDDYKLIRRLASISSVRCYYIDPVFDSLPEIDSCVEKKSVLVLYSPGSHFSYSKRSQCDYLEVDRCTFLDEEVPFFKKLIGYKFIVVCDCDAYTDHLIIVSALGCVILDLSRNFYLRCLYPAINTAGFSLEECYDYIAKIDGVNEYRQYLVDYAKSYSKKYFSLNCLFRLIPFSDVESNLLLGKEGCYFLDKIKYISGSLGIELAEDQFCVFCLVKNGFIFVKEWLNYYRNIGASHFFIVDNESSDGTFEYLMEQSDITLFTTCLPFKFYESVIRNFIVSVYCKDMWCLSVDIDEFFDYPHSDKITMQAFISYQNINGYTAVIANMLDMFSDSLVVLDNQPLQERYRHYDVESIEKKNYHFYSKDLNLLNNNENDGNIVYSSGIRSRFCQVVLPIHEYLLVKHPLTFQDGCLDPHINPHFCNRSDISDTTCALYHYKFVDANVSSVVERMDANNAGIFVAYEYAAYLKFYQDNSGFSFSTNSMREFQNHQSILDSDFFTISNKYIKHIKSRCN